MVLKDLSSNQVAENSPAEDISQKHKTRKQYMILKSIMHQVSGAYIPTFSNAS